MKKVERNERIDTLDYLRGFSLLGIILVNILAMLSAQKPLPNTQDAFYQRFLFLFVEGRFYPIFSFLFGVGMYIFLTRAERKGKNATILFLRRIIVLFIFGFIHFIFQPGEALTVYASCGLILLPFYKVRKEINLAIGILLLILFAILAMKIFMTVPLILLGLAAGQYRVFEEITHKRKQITIFTVSAFLLAALGLFFQYQHMPLAPFNPFHINRFLTIGIMIGPIVSAFYVGILILLLQSQFFRKILSPLKSYGRMSLTNYVSQTVFILVVGKAFDLFRHITYLHTLYICLVIYFIQLLFSAIWLRFFQYGPLEWIWRLATYKEKP
ncbi:DUF418 domain-containing protein [Bacillus salipaludis]|uniref:DUF418 domain-containing protein n=1 Tax=Bacillus salipaludis TaxID=2547811 RepID=A0AA90TE89_9BACI|nr:DUF418 domain-containing protein [Bacillus salipaludis]MDQ6599352.1 DUF418 domain-containing protein [Bacillus salipaludis]